MIALLGASGYVGQAFQRFLAREDIAFVPLSRRHVNYYDPERLAVTLREIRPEVVINAAGFTGRPNVDACENRKTDCLLANTALPAIVAQVCRDLGVVLGHVSSGCIYTGTRPDGQGFRESDRPNFSFRQNNCSFYSGCKALAEELLDGSERCYVWRLRLPFNHEDGPRNYISKLLRYERLLDARNSLSHIDEFVAACFECWQMGAAYGIYHLTNSGSATTREVVDLLLQQGLLTEAPCFFDSEDEFLQTTAVAPRSNCVLDNSKAVAAGLRLSPVHDALQSAIQHWRT